MNTGPANVVSEIGELPSVVLHSSEEHEQTYNIPLRYRKMENLHIVFWLFKDISWCMVWRPLGIAMIFPTLIVSIIIAWRTRKYVSELCHNLAITVWISANSYWMISEFFGFDSKIAFAAVDYKHLAMIPFCIGVAILGYYYLYFKPKHRGQAETM
ncbi:MAG: hypothetical protein ABI861_03550 [Panacibacter sp.]